MHARFLHASPQAPTGHEHNRLICNPAYPSFKPAFYARSPPQPDWYAELLAATEAEANGSEEARSAVSFAVPSKWTLVPQAGKKPLPRYEHAAAVMGGKMYMAGGNYSEYGKNCAAKNRRSCNTGGVRSG